MFRLEITHLLAYFYQVDMAFAKGLKDDGFSLEEPVVYVQGGGGLVAFSAKKKGI